MNPPTYQHGERLAVVSAKLDMVEDRVERVDGKVDALDAKLDQVLIELARKRSERRTSDGVHISGRALGLLLPLAGGVGAGLLELAKLALSK